ncbi:MAG: hypothetical protein IKR17_00965 [Bacteroidales bacterium]|nr:hypothetical protein [Bacteroidales bacterium]
MKSKTEQLDCLIEQKQKAYASFLERIKVLTTDDNIVASMKDDDISGVMKEVLYQVMQLRLYADEATIKVVLNNVRKIVVVTNNFASEKQQSKKTRLPHFYSKYAMAISNIAQALNNNLNGVSNEKGVKYTQKEDVLGLLHEYGHTIDPVDFDKKEVYLCFWEGLEKMLAKRGYKVDVRDRSAEIDAYYSSARDRHRWMGLTFNINPNKGGRPVRFKIEVGNDYYYGIMKSEKGHTIQIVNESVKPLLQPNDRSTDWWYLCRQPQKASLRLDFWTLKSEGFLRLQDINKRDAFITEVVDEIDTFIKSVQAELKKRSV